MGQVFQFSEISSKLKDLRKGKKLVFTNGCFDLLHVGHVRYLKEAKQQGDILVVAVNSDNSVKKLKGPTRPIQNEDDRAEILAALSCVDAVLIFDEQTPEKLITEIRPDVLVKGGDWKPDQIVGGTFVQSYGGKVLSLTFVAGKSTTSLVQKSQS